MDKIEIGEYVRSDKGYIWKETSENFSQILTKDGLVFGNVAKHSKDITELIETKDILKIKEDNSTVYVGLEKDELTITYKDVIDNIKNGKIELLEILTHEQFKRNSYKVEV